MRIARGIEQMLMGLLPTPLSILGASSVAAWYRSDMGITIGTGVAAWADQSGNGRHLLQAVAGAQPALVAGATPNGKPVLRFTKASGHFLKTAGFALNQPTHVVIVHNPVSDAAGTTFFDGNATNGLLVYHNAGEANNTRLFAGGAVGPVTLAAGTWRVTDALSAGAASRLAVNNGVPATGNAGANNAGGFTLSREGGVGGVLGGQDVSEIVIVNRALTATERAALTAYLRAWSGV